MKRFLMAILCAALVIGILPFPVHGTGGQVVIDRQDTPFPADTTITGDLLLTDDCPKTVILINVIVEGTLKIEAEHEITVRLQGSSRCENVELMSPAQIIGGSCGTVVSHARIARLTGSSAESVTLEKDGGYFLADGELGTVTMNGERGLLAGNHHAKSLTICKPGCSIGGRYDSTEKTFTEPVPEETAPINHGVKAEIRLDRPAVSPAENIIHGTITFTEVPEEMQGDYRIYWYIGDMYADGSWHLDVAEGTTAEFTCSAHFDGVMPEYLPVWAELTSTSDSSVQLRFATPVAVEGYSTAEYQDVEFGSDIFPYEIHLYRNHNVVVVYGLDEAGSYSKIVNVFVCSVGTYTPTPTGEYEINYKARWGSLNLNVWGQFVSQFFGNMLFHSVPYRSDQLDDLEWEQYNLLGSPASSGCVRMATRDAMWIYDHCRKGTRVTIFDSETCPVEKPVPVRIDEDSRLRGWDPTDPNPKNPTRAASVPILRPEQDPALRRRRPEPLFQ